MRKNELELREIQLEGLKVLKKIKEICEKENIKYFLTYGTLIGAVRHNGFIPWDDDIDIAMLREDYEKFIEYCIKNKEILYPFELKHYKTDKNYIYPIARFCNKEYFIEYNLAKDYGLGIFVDIYPLDNYKKNIFFVKRMRMRNLIIVLAGLKKYQTSKKGIIKSILKYFFYFYSQKINLNKYIEKSDLLAQRYNNNTIENVECTVWDYEYNEIPKACFLETILQKFEDDYFPIPKGYDKYLKLYYGDYMKLPRKEERVPHHNYKVYRKKCKE